MGEDYMRLRAWSPLRILVGFGAHPPMKCDEAGYARHPNMIGSGKHFRRTMEKPSPWNMRNLGRETAMVGP